MCIANLLLGLIRLLVKLVDVSLAFGNYTNLAQLRCVWSAWV